MTTDVSPKIKIIQLDNPLDFTQRTETWAECRPGAVLLDYIPEIDGGEYVVSVSGGVVEASQWGEYSLSADDTVVMLPVVYGRGGGGGKAILRLVAMVVLTYFTMGAASPWAAGMAAGQASAFAAAGAAYVAGAVLINALLPVTPPKAPKNDLEDSPSYGINGPKNTSNEGIAVPVIYGKHKFAGNMIGLYTRSAGKSQYLYMLLNAGEGPIAQISDIKLNDQPLASFQGTEHVIGLGVADQPPPPWFGDTMSPLALSGTPALPHWSNFTGTIENSAPNPGQFIEMVTGDVVDELRFDFIAPLGLMRVNDKGKQFTHAVQLRVGYKRVNADGSDIAGEGWKFTVNAGGIESTDDSYDYFGPGDDEEPSDPVDPGFTPPVAGDGATPLQPPLDDPFNNGVGPFPQPVLNPDDEDNEFDRGTVPPDDRERWEYSPPEAPPGVFLPRTIEKSATLRPGTYVDANDVIRDSATNAVVGAKTRISIVEIDDGENPRGDGANLSGYPGSFFSFSGKSRVALRLNLYTGSLTQGYYKIRIGRGNAAEYESNDKISDLVQVEAINGIIRDDVAYRHTAWLALRVKISDQLSSVPNVTFVHHGVLVKVWNKQRNEWVWENSNNPAWVCLDMLTNTRYGGAVPWDRIDLTSFREWADYCASLDVPLTFNGPFDQSMSMWDALKYVCRAGHAQIVRNGSRFSIVIERADTPVMMFSEANIVQDSFQTNWLSLAERANAVQVTYFDAARDWERQEIRVVSPLITPGEEERTSQLTLYGVTSRDRAIREGWLQLNLNNHITRTIEFEANIDAIACSVGSLIAVKHVGVNYEAAGRLVETATTSPTTIKLDQDLKFLAGASYRVLLHFPAFGLDIPAAGGCAITQIDPGMSTVVVGGVYADNSVPLNANGDTWLPGKVTHLQIWRGGSAIQTLRVRKVEPAAGLAQVIIEDPLDNVMVGDNVRMVYGDLVFESAINHPGVSPINVVTLTTNLPIVHSPGAYAHWMIGEVTREVRKYRVISITGSGSQYTRTITALEYKDTIYTTAGFLSPDDPYGPAPTGPGDPVDYTRYIGPVRMPKEVEDTGGNWLPKERIDWGATNPFIISLSWRKPGQGAYKGVDIFKQYSDDNLDDWEFVGTFPDATEATFALPKRDKNALVRFKIQAFDTWGRRSAFTAAPVVPNTIKFYLVGAAAKVDDAVVTAVSATPLMRQIALSWTVNDLDKYAGAMVYALAGAETAPESGVYADPPNTPEAAILIGEVSGGRRDFIHMVESGKYRYWVKAVDQVDNVQEDFVGGVIASPLRTLADLYDDSPEALWDELNQIITDIIARTPNIVRYEDYTSVNDAVLQMVDSYWNQFQGMAGLNTRDNQIYAAVLNETATRITEDSALASQISLVGAAVEDANALIVAEQTARANADSAIATSVTAVSARVDTAEAAIATETTARADADGALAAQITALGVRADGIEATVQTETTARISGDAAEAAARSALAAQINDDIQAAVASEASARVTADGAISTRIDQVDARLNDPATGLMASASFIDALESTVNNGTTGVAALNTRINLVQATVEDPATGLVATATDLNSLEQEVRHSTTGLTATANRVSAVETSVSQRIRTYTQNDPPTGTFAAGDLWFDTNDGNRQYRWNGSAWAAVDDNTRNRTHVGATQPANDGRLNVGDLWVDTRAASGTAAEPIGGNIIWRWDGSAWQRVNDQRIISQAQQISTLQSFVDTNSANITSISGIRGRVNALDGVDGGVTGSVTTLQSVVLTGPNRNDQLRADVTTAQLSANNANALVADISADDKLTPVEKQALRAEWNAIDAQRTRMYDQALASSLLASAEYTNYTTATANLAFYLNNNFTWSGATPTWINDANLTTTTNISGATLRNLIKEYYDKYQALMNKIAEDARSRASTALTRYAVTLDSNGVISGFEIRNQSGTITQNWSSAKFYVDSFKIVAPGSPGTDLFYVDVNGFTGPGFYSMGTGAGAPGVRLGGRDNLQQDVAALRFYRWGTFYRLYEFEGDLYWQYSDGFSPPAYKIIHSGNVGTYAAPPSDARLKTDIRPIRSALETVLSLDGKTFTWVDDVVAKAGFANPPVHTRTHGLIAQEVAKVLPDAVEPLGQNPDYLGVRYDKLVPVLIEAIKQQQEQIEWLMTLNGKTPERKIPRWKRLLRALVS